MAGSCDLAVQSQVWGYLGCYQTVGLPPEPVAGVDTHQRARIAACTVGRALGDLPHEGPTQAEKGALDQVGTALQGRGKRAAREPCARMVFLYRVRGVRGLVAR